ncbi:hypothetical protein [Daejeonella sp.]|uniref:hypothetical protein n=1 Tax=Daejeonella sp. TaxID=2805397 RepID=UPI0025BF4A1C|nr:hypothetical protein [Daejeonella sp.]
MKKYAFALILLLFVNYSYSQEKNGDKLNIKHTITFFLHWYKNNENKIETVRIIKGLNENEEKKGDSLARIDMDAVDVYLFNLKKSNFVSQSYLNNIRYYYQEIADTLKKYPLVDYFGPIGGLEADLILGFEPEETLDYINKGVFTRIYIVGDKAIAQFDIVNHVHLIFTLSKVEEKWLIDDLEFNVDYYNPTRK